MTVTVEAHVDESNSGGDGSGTAGDKADMDVITLMRLMVVLLIVTIQTDHHHADELMAVAVAK